MRLACQKWSVAPLGRLWLLALAVIAILSFTPWAHAKPIVLEAREDGMPVGSFVEYLIDETGKLTFDDVRTRKDLKWQASTSDVPSFGLSHPVVWYRLELAAAESLGGNWALEIAYPNLNEVDFYSTAGSGKVTHHQAGNLLPFDVRPVPNRHPTFPLVTTPGQSTQLYLRIATAGPQKLPAVIWTRPLLAGHVERTALYHGAYFGLMFVMALYNLFIYFALRDRSYLLYVAYVFSMVTFMLYYQGAAFHSLWPDTPILNRYLPLPAMSCAMIFACLFPRRFLSVRLYSPGLDRLLLVLAGASGVCMLASFLSYNTIVIIIPLAGLMTPVAVVVGAVAYRNGVQAARFYLYGWGVALLGIFGLMASILGWMPVNWLTDNTVLIGTGLEVVLFSLALADRINVIKADRARAQAKALAIQTEATNDLQLEVARQTQELTEKNEQLELYDKRKTSYFQNISHELRTPLTLILNPLEAMTSEDRYAKESRLQVAVRNARRLLRLVNQVLDFQKLRAGKKTTTLEPLELVGFIRVLADYFGSACSAKNVRLELKLEDNSQESDVETPCFIMADADGMEKVLFNYLSNALKHSPEGGTITLGLEREVVGAAERARLTVSDQGSGIAAEDLGLLFDVFSQVGDDSTRNMGSGLGLALVKELATEMNGKVGVESELGKGSCFSVTFPTVPEPAEVSLVRHRPSETLALALVSELRGEAPQPATIDTLSENSGEERLRILVVDDLEDMRALIAQTLLTAGFEVTTAPDGAQALEYLHNPDAPTPSLIVTDWMMPRLDGPGLIAAVRETPENRALPIVLLTARSDEESKIEGTEIGADAFLGKPFGDNELISTVRNLLRLKSKEREVEALNRHLTDNVLKRFLPPTVVDEILDGRFQLGSEPESRIATILFADLQGFTAASNKLRAAKMARLLNEYFTVMTEAIFEHLGTIDKFIGDGIMVIFGAPTRVDPPEQALRAARCARAMQAAMTELQHEWGARGIDGIKLRIGIHQGPVVVGPFGSPLRSDYTAIGPTVNLAARLESACEPGQVYVSGEVCDFLGENEADEVGTRDLKGIAGKVACFRLRLNPADATTSTAGPVVRSPD